jgi:hypothetical protein
LKTVHENIYCLVHHNANLPDGGGRHFAPRMSDPSNPLWVSSDSDVAEACSVFQNW